MTLRLFLIAGISLLMAYHSLYGQIKFAKTKTSDLPQSLKYKGQVINAIKWKDSLGINYFLVTEEDKPDEDAEFKINIIPEFYHFVAKDTGYRLIWRFVNTHSSFPLRFIDKAFTVTDLDGNGVAEVWHMYQWMYLDSTEESMKLVMNENNQMYNMWRDASVKDKPENEKYAFGDGLKDNNGAFKDFAIKLWTQYHKQ